MTYLQVFGLALLAAGVVLLLVAWPWALVAAGAVLVAVPELVEGRRRR